VRDAIQRARARSASRLFRPFAHGALALAFSAQGVAPGAARAHPGMHETIELLTERIATTPNQQSLYLERGIAYSSDGKVELALADLRKAEQLGDPDLVAFDLGVLFFRTGQLSEARASLTRCLARFPQHALARDYRARAARDAGDARAALRDYEALFAIEGDVNPGHYLSAAGLLASLDGDGIPAALAMLDRGMAAVGVIPQLQQRAIAYERERGATDAALRRHDTLAEALAHSPAWRADRAELLLALGRADEAKRELDTAAGALAVQRLTPARAELAARIGRLAQTAAHERAPNSGAKEKP
jgi:tetratricopeptide (TPR) repeat protein